MEIIICDTNQLKREEHVKFISDYLLIEELKMEIVLETNDPEKVLTYVQNYPKTRLYFLDLNLRPTITGIDLAHAIRKCDHLGPIIYITDHIELMGLIFEQGIGALGFIKKNHSDEVRERIEYYLELVNQRFLLQENNDSVFVYKSGSKVFRQAVRDIQFFQVSEKGEKLIGMYTNTGVEKFHGKITDIEKKNHQFFRCHRSCVVNINNISTVDVEIGEIMMTTGDVCYGSVRGIKKLIDFMKR
ncbi:MAG: LytTR family DNA-binding domain-containing protein [Defluviitaleaceae bacterium]|nr:LytTR family DNA-binding domain-containing protein [Defluviitaleaceae bacterium]